MGSIIGHYKQQTGKEVSFVRTHTNPVLHVLDVRCVFVWFGRKIVSKFPESHGQCCCQEVK